MLRHVCSTGDWLELLRCLTTALRVPHRIIVGAAAVHLPRIVRDQGVPGTACHGTVCQRWHSTMLVRKMMNMSLGHQGEYPATLVRIACNSSRPCATEPWSRFGRTLARSFRRAHPICARSFLQTVPLRSLLDISSYQVCCSSSMAVSDAKLGSRWQRTGAWPPCAKPQAPNPWSPRPGRPGQQSASCS